MVAEGQIGYVFEDGKNQSEKPLATSCSTRSRLQNRTESHVTIKEQKLLQKSDRHNAMPKLCV